MRCHIDIVNFHLTSGIGAPQGMSIPRLEQLDAPRDSDGNPHRSADGAGLRKSPEKTQKNNVYAPGKIPFRKNCCGNSCSLPVSVSFLLSGASSGILLAFAVNIVFFFRFYRRLIFKREKNAICHRCESAGKPEHKNAAVRNPE